METVDAIKMRRSIRKFKNDEIPKEVIMEAIKYGTMAPSAHNRQPWKFKILSREDILYLADKLEEKTKDILDHTGPHTAMVMRNTPAMVMIFLDSREDNKDMDIISVGACIENMILYLTDCGLGTLWIGNTNLINEEIKEYFKTDLDTISCLGIGIRGQEPHERPRKKIEEVIL